MVYTLFIFISIYIYMYSIYTSLSLHHRESRGAIPKFMLVRGGPMRKYIHIHFCPLGMYDALSRWYIYTFSFQQETLCNKH